ncbi:MAG: serine protease [Actinocatenispora sp.]
MTRRRSVLLVTGLCAVAALAVAGDAVAGGPVSGWVTGSSPTASSHTALAGYHSSADEPVARSRTHADRGAQRPTGAADQDTATAAHGRSDARDGHRTETGPTGGQEAGQLDQVTRHVNYTGQSRITFRYPGAEYVKVHFSRLVLRPGDSITVSDPSGEQKYRYSADPRLLEVPGDSPSTKGRDGFWAMSVTGDTAVVALHRTLPGPSLTRLGVDIDKVAHGFTAAQRSTREHNEMMLNGGRRAESVCGMDDSADAVCYESRYPVEYRHSLPVARLLINGTTLCTAWRVTADDRMLTNHHCLSDQSDVDNTEVWFNYQCSICGGSISEPVTKVPAARLLRTDPTLDYTLFTVSHFEAIRQFGYLSLDIRTPRSGEEVYIPQHPEGEPTKLAISSDADDDSTCRIEYPVVDGYAHDSDTAYRCDTAPGSSGSPVISRRTNRVIAIHHLGGCPNSGVRMDMIYREIKSLL